MAYSGFIADSRTLVDRARLEARNYAFNYGKAVPVEGLVQAVSRLALEFGDDDAKAAMSRPFGVALLFAGWADEGPQLYARRVSLVVKVGGRGFPPLRPRRSNVII